MKRDELFEKIAKDHLSIETLKERGLDRLDFHEVSVSGLKNALEAAYEVGRKNAQRKELNQ